MQTFIALVPRPVESICAAELAEIPGVAQIRVQPGAVLFSGTFETLYRVNLWSRCASRILLQLADFPCPDAAALYEQAQAIPWDNYLSPQHSFAVHAQGQLPTLRHTMYTSQRVKDAIVDFFRDRFATRPSLDPQTPDLQIHAQLYVAQDTPRCSLSLDSSGIPLSFRGYRKLASLAPIKENVAAVLLRMAGYTLQNCEFPLVDPFCGSGTFLIEAAWIAMNRAPGLLRSFAFERWPGFDAPRWKALQQEAQSWQRPLPRGTALFGLDLDPKAIQHANQHAQWARLDPTSIQWRVQAFEHLRPPSLQAGWVVANPPYGERLGDETLLVSLYQSIGHVFKQWFPKWNAFVFTANLPLSRQIGLRPESRQIVYNGNLEGRWLHFTLYNGTQKQKGRVAPSP